MMTPKMTPDEIAAIQEWLLILEARDLELPEFHAMQLKVAKTTHVMLDRIAALEAELAVERDRLEAKKLEVDAAMDCYKAALNAMRKDWREMFESTQAAGVELAAERERREAANGLLHFYADLANAAMVGANRDGAEYDRAAEMLDYRRYCKRYKND